MRIGGKGAVYKSINMGFTDNKQDIDKNWTLFLDRDGVINIESVGSYMTDWHDFVFLDGALEAIKMASNLFGTIVVVSNQRGVGRGIMSLDALKEINRNLKNTVAENGGTIDKIYNCTATSDEDHNSKPNTGMGLQAQEDFPQIDFKRSIMVGNSMPDMEFGKRLNMGTVFITTKHDPVALPHNLIDKQYASLYDWVNTFIMAPIEK